ncbi:MAG: DUF5686 and carboxypeptidase regulatory-like domain-containing protein [Bacteroidia bacterium]|nr:DUF5686 and carboxypeptidase regulatory-like domain-containing protein [Bacteroidia bacterium]
MQRLWLLIGGVWAQIFSIQGQVIDPTGHPLSYVIVRLPQTGFQTVSGQDGRFTLSFVGDTAIIELRYLGYRVRRDTLLQRENQASYSFVLYPQEVRLPNVVITEGNKDPAELLIQKAIAAKERNKSCLPAFRVETYTLYTLRWGESGTLIRRFLDRTYAPGEVVFMSEALSYTYFTPPNKYKEEIIRSRVVGSRSYSFLGNWIFQGFDPYGERIELQEMTETPFILPLARDAFLYYRYRLIGSYWDDNGFFYKIAIEPRSAVSPCVEGYVILADESYALIGLEWTVKGPRPIRYTDSLGVRATYVPVGECYQLGEVSFRGCFELSLPVGKVTFTGEGYAAYKKYVLLVEGKKTPPSKLAVPSASNPKETSERIAPIETLRVTRLDYGEKVRVLPHAAETSEAFWDSVRQAPIDSAQVAYLRKQDSLVSQPDTTKHPQSRKRVRLIGEGLSWEWRKWEEDLFLQASISALWPMYTRLEGWVLPFKVKQEYRKQNQVWEAEGWLRYGLGWSRLAPIGSLRWEQRTFPLYQLAVRGGIEIREPTDFPQVPFLWNTIYYLTRREAPWVGYRRPFAEIEGERYLHRTFQASLRLTWDQRPWSQTGESYYTAWRAAALLRWEPGTQSFSTPRRTLLLPAEGIFRWGIAFAGEIARLPQQVLFSWTGGTTAHLSISPLGELQARIGLSWQNRENAPWTERLYPSTAPLVFHRFYTDLARWPLYLAGGKWIAQGVLTWLPQGAVLRLLPLIKRTSWQENCTIRALYTPSLGWHVEGSLYVTNINFRLRRTGALRPFSIGMHTGLVGAYRSGSISVGVGNPTPRPLRIKPGLL